MRHVYSSHTSKAGDINTPVVTFNAMGSASSIRHVEQARITDDNAPNIM